jgi:hypothetical protein
MIETAGGYSGLLFAAGHGQNGACQNAGCRWGFQKIENCDGTGSINSLIIAGH